MNAALIIALNTFRELVRGKTLYGVFFVSIIIVAVSALFGSVSVGDKILVIKDFGLFSVSLSAVIFAVITGATLLYKELERKTIYNILSKPVKRWEFVIGKFLGMFCTQVVFLILTTLVLCIFVSLFEGRMDINLLIAAAYICLEIFIVCAATLFFSSLVVTPALNGLFSLGFFMAGRSVDYILALIEQEGFSNGILPKALKAIYYLLPHLPQLNISNDAVFGSIPTLNYSIWAILYAFSYASVLLILASIIFSRREFN